MDICAIIRLLRGEGWLSSRVIRGRCAYIRVYLHIYVSICIYTCHRGLFEGACDSTLVVDLPCIYTCLSAYIRVIVALRVTSSCFPPLLDTADTERGPGRACTEQCTRKEGRGRREASLMSKSDGHAAGKEPALVQR